jgi:hypothetical protein
MRRNAMQIYDKDGHLLAYFRYGGGLPDNFITEGIAIDKNNRDRQRPSERAHTNFPLHH